MKELRPVLTACFSAGLGFLLAKTMNGSGAQAHQPLAQANEGGVITTNFAVLLLIPLMAGARAANEY